MTRPKRLPPALPDAEISEACAAITSAEVPVLTRATLLSVLAAILYAGDADLRRAATDEPDHPDLRTKPYKAVVVAREILDDVEGMLANEKGDAK